MRMHNFGDGVSFFLFSPNRETLNNNCPPKNTTYTYTGNTVSVAQMYFTGQLSTTNKYVIPGE